MSDVVKLFIILPSVADAAVVSVPDKENGHLPRAFVVLKGGHEETEENLINFLESRLQDHERLRGGLYYIKNIPRDENWKVTKDQFYLTTNKHYSVGGPSVVEPKLMKDTLANLS